MTNLLSASSKHLWTIMDYLYFFLVFFTLSASCSGNLMGNECDWTDSGLSSPDHSRVVTPVYLRCSAGRISWLYPRGALRVILRLPANDREFRACIRIHPNILPSSLSHPKSFSTKSYLFPARLFLEGPRSLHSLYSEDDSGKGNTVRCFQSKKGQAAIYVEAIEGDEMLRRVAEFEYDLEPLPRGKGYDPIEECRPCTGEELAHAFCTSDLVTRGVILGVANYEDRDLSEVNVKLTKLIRHTTEDGYTDTETNAIPESELATFSTSNTAELLLEVPRHCGVSHGSGEFVFMARRKLGKLALRCAPRLEDWRNMMKTLTEEGKTHCVLRS